MSPETKRYPGGGGYGARGRARWSHALGRCWRERVESAFGGRPSSGAPLPVGTDAVLPRFHLGAGSPRTWARLEAFARAAVCQGVRPVLLVLRPDSPRANVARCARAAWRVLEGEEALRYLRVVAGVDFREELRQRMGPFALP